MARAASAGDVVREIWEQAQEFLVMQG